MNGLLGRVISCWGYVFHKGIMDRLSFCFRLAIKVMGFRVWLWCCIFCNIRLLTFTNFVSRSCDVLSLLVL